MSGDSVTASGGAPPEPPVTFAATPATQAPWLSWPIRKVSAMERRIAMGSSVPDGEADEDEPGEWNFGAKRKSGVGIRRPKFRVAPIFHANPGDEGPRAVLEPPQRVQAYDVALVDVPVDPFQLCALDAGRPGTGAGILTVGNAR